MKCDVVFAARLFLCHSKEPFCIWKDILFKHFVSFVYFYGASATFFFLIIIFESTE